MNTTIKFAKVRPTAIIPHKRSEDAGYDIYADFEEDEFLISPFCTKLVPTGVASALETNFYLQVEEKGNTGNKGMKKSAGVIDSGYRGEIFIALFNANDLPLVISKFPPKEYLGENVVYYSYDKPIAQLVLHEVHNAEIQIIPYEDLQKIPSERGVGKLGSTILASTILAKRI